MPADLLDTLFERHIADVHPWHRAIAKCAKTICHWIFNSTFS